MRHHGAGRRPLGYVERIDQLAGRHPDATAVVAVSRTGAEQSISWRHLREQSRRRGAQLAALGVGPGSLVVLALENGWQHFSLALGAWRTGAAVMPLPHRMPPPERDDVVELAASTWRVMTVCSDDATPTGESLSLTELGQVRAVYPGSGADVPVPGGELILCTGGSTGRPKLIRQRGSLADVPTEGRLPGLPGALGMRAGQVQLMAAPLHHGAPVAWSLRGLFHDHTLVLMEKFEPAMAVDLIARHEVQWAFLVPTMLGRMAKVPGVQRSDFDSVEVVWSASAPCPAWVKRFWIDLLGPARVREAYGGSEGAGATVVTGEEWLRHPGTVGRVAAPWEIRILDDAGRQLPAGEVGTIYFRDGAHPGAVGFEYVGAEAHVLDDGWVSLGDLGRLDAEGYLYIADRRTDLIVVGGANVYPAEIEAVLSQHPAVHDVVVVGLPDPDMGQRVRAIVQPVDPASPPDVTELRQFFVARKATYKQPHTYEFAVLPRDEFGKIRRSQLRLARQTIPAVSEKELS